MKPHDIFEANDLFENTNHTQVQSTLIALASQVTLLGRDGARGPWGVAGEPQGVPEGPHVPLEDTNHTQVQSFPHCPHLLGDGAKWGKAKGSGEPWGGI